MLTICVGYGVLGLVNLGNPFPEARKSLCMGVYNMQVFFRQYCTLLTVVMYITLGGENALGC